MGGGSRRRVKRWGEKRGVGEERNAEHLECEVAGCEEEGGAHLEQHLECEEDRPRVVKRAQRAVQLRGRVESWRVKAHTHCGREGDHTQRMNKVKGQAG
jgi:hypothetical protein